ncbi:WD repeat-containing protein 36-like, partial [Anarrhichthys ocellatus]|uniref:WD repeat-containing protein 36-like n=1 Tax=Anarrhichthys ocellatus TaxID=433405 RepID=UPI0012EE35C5
CPPSCRPDLSSSLQVWIFDQEGGGPRLLRSRQGHSAPPTTIHHHGNDGKNILSAGQDGTLQSFSTVHERFNKNLGHGSINKKKEQKKKKGLSYEELRLPAITAFSSAAARQSDWDGIVACHRGRLATTTWNYQRCTMGAHHLQPPATRRTDIATAVDITSCGNFAVIGSSSGRVDVYNLQSGQHRGCYGNDETAHSGAVRGVATDTLNQLTLTAGSDWLLKFWRFKSRKQEEQLKLLAAPASMMLHRDSGMLALAQDDFTLLVVDIETRRIVRKFAGHHGNINDMTFSPDGRWLITVAMDCTIRTWDLPSGFLVDCFLVAMAPVGVSLSPTGDFLSTAHIDSLGVYLWTNKSLCGPVGLRPLPADYQPAEVTLPGVTVDESEQEVTSEEVDDAYKSAEQLGAELVTLSLLPESRWKSLLYLDNIRVSQQSTGESPQV